MRIKPYLIIPNLIEKPTWGGEYLTKFKRLNNSKLQGKNIGQSYELYEFTNLSSKTSTGDNPSVELGRDQAPEKSQLISENDEILSLQNLIDCNPQAVLGKKVVKLQGKKIQILIKFTQASGNSYQIHLKKPTPGTNWLPKPESWYYLEPGLVTLGVRNGISWQDYRNACAEIEVQAQKISLKILKGRLSLSDGRQRLNSLIEEVNPERFVNCLRVEKNQSIDLSGCGIHHSWEENMNTHPLGNILYEVQKNVYDDRSTIRCFDKGKIQADGSVRTIHIDDYFKYIDRSVETNTPQTHLKPSKPIFLSDRVQITQIFDSDHYKLQEMHFNDQASNPYTCTSDSFHHLFVRQGSVIVSTGKTSWQLTQGYSLFVPARTGSYEIAPRHGSISVILKTYL